MNNTMLVKITMPSETIFEGEAKMVNLPGSEGVFGVLPGHAKLIAKIAIGCISVFLGGQEKKFFIYEGIAQITLLEVNIVSEFVMDLERQYKNEILNKLSQMILDKKINGILDQGRGSLIIYEDSSSNEYLDKSLKCYKNLDKVVDSLMKKAKASNPLD